MYDDPRNVSLHVHGTIVQGWSHVTIMRSLQHIASSFSFGYSDKWEATSTPFPINAGDACQVRMGKRLVLNGYVDECQIAYSHATHELTASGRSKAGDLVDCSVVHETGQWANIDILNLAQQLCKPFGIAVTKAEGLDIGEAKKQATQESETVFEMLDRITKEVGVLMMSTANGDLVITQSGDRTLAGAHVTLGKNALKGALVENWVKRHSVYVVKAHIKGADTDPHPTAITADDNATDPSVKRNRPLTIIVSAATTTENIKKRAKWECNVRAARSAKYSLTVPGWTYDGKNLWEPNCLVRVDDEKLDVHDNMLITDVKYEVNSRTGVTTELTFMDKSSFSKTPILPKRRRRDQGWRKPGYEPGTGFAYGTVLKQDEE